MLADEQAWRQFQRLEALEIERAIREAAETVEPSDSSENELADGEESDEEEEQKARPSRENTPPWSQELSDVHTPVCTATPLVLLPRHRVRTELGVLQCFIDQSLIDTIVTNTDLYAAARQAVAWVDTTSEEDVAQPGSANSARHRRSTRPCTTTGRMTTATATSHS